MHKHPIYTDSLANRSLMLLGISSKVDDGDFKYKANSVDCSESHSYICKVTEI